MRKTAVFGIAFLTHSAIEVASFFDPIAKRFLVWLRSALNGMLSFRLV
jgi:hypothetical protein